MIRLQLFLSKLVYVVNSLECLYYVDMIQNNLFEIKYM